MHYHAWLRSGRVFTMSARVFPGRTAAHNWAAAAAVGRDLDRAHADALADTIRQAADELPRRGVRSSGEICPVCSMDDEEDEQR